MRGSLLTMRWLITACGWYAGAVAACPAPETLQAGRAEAEIVTGQSAAQIGARWDRLLQDTAACEDPDLQLSLWEQRTDALLRAGDLDAALASAQEWLARAGVDRNPAARAKVLLRISRMHSTRGDMLAAIGAVNEANTLLEGVGTAAERADARSERARLHRRRGNYLEALRDEHAALALREQSADTANLWRSRLNIAVLYEQVELLDQARLSYEEALRSVSEHGNERDRASVLTGFAGFLNDFGAEHAARSLAMAEQAVAINRALGEPIRLGSSVLQLGRAHFASGQLDAAEDAYRQALGLALAADAEALQAHVQFRWGELELLRGQPDAALKRVDAARLDYELQGNRHRLIKVHELLERIHARRQDPLHAAMAGREHYRLRNELLGAGASSRFAALLADYALADVRDQNVALQLANTASTQKLRAEQMAQRYLLVMVSILVLALIALGWRHRQSRQLNRLLRQQSAVIEARRIELAAAHERLKVQSAQLYQASITDPLTGLRNRAYGLNALRELLASAPALGLRPVVMMLDIDHFKSINDQYGHAVGDRALERVAENLLVHAPTDAIVARLGGEEFLFVLRDADPSSGMFQAELIRRRLLELPVEHDGGVLRITVSIGLCAASDLPQPSVQAALRSADQALYRAKHAGRNCVRSA